MSNIITILIFRSTGDEITKTTRLLTWIRLNDKLVGEFYKYKFNFFL